MFSLAIAFLTTLIVTQLIIRYDHLHGHVTGDSDLSGPQKFHSHAVPRIGGLGIAIGLIVAAIARYFMEPVTGVPLLALLGCAIPAFVVGFVEDMTKKVSVKVRLFGTAISAGIAGWVFSAWLTRVDVFGVDMVLAIPVVAVIFTCIAVAGLANAYNIIDGFNGLASMVAIISLMAIGYVGFRVGDPLVPVIAVVMIGAVAGFFVWNYPRGLIFLGDGGAYLIGFWIGMLSILLVVRNANVSPWFPVLVNAYPIFETLFTIWRRTVHQGKSASLPDGTHFHTLIFRRVLRWAHTREDGKQNFVGNARTSPYLWILSVLAAIPALLWWHYTWVLQVFAVVFAVTYLWLYRALVKFKTPWWLS
jgi:UDP-GlcNAc:undecaprenyl-phosphate GlcNAc-1-phosphate transferase